MTRFLTLTAIFLLLALLIVVALGWRTPANAGDTYEWDDNTRVRIQDTAQPGVKGDFTASRVLVPEPMTRTLTIVRMENFTNG